MDSSTTHHEIILKPPNDNVCYPLSLPFTHSDTQLSIHNQHHIHHKPPPTRRKFAKHDLSNHHSSPPVIFHSEPSIDPTHPPLVFYYQHSPLPPPPPPQSSSSSLEHPPKQPIHISSSSNVEHHHLNLLDTKMVLQQDVATSSSVVVVVEPPVTVVVERKKTWADMAKPAAAQVPVQKFEYSGKVVPPCGIYNSGNMCYMNVVLQVLVHSPAFRNMVLHPSLSSSSSNKQGHGGVLDAVKNLVLQYIATDTVVVNAEDVFQAIQGQTPFVKGRQEDAHEFLGYLLQAMHLEYKVKKSPITQLFTGTSRSVLKVGHPGNDRVNSLEEFQCLPVDINNARVQSVSDALRCMLEPELISGMSGVGTHLYKQLQLVELPVILIVQLNRFTYTTDGIAKVSKHVQIENVLQINNRTYKLFGVVNHHGSVANGGHYTCDVIQYAKSWVRMDDSELMHVNLDDVVAYKRDREPYLLFYECAQRVFRIAHNDLVRPAVASVPVTATPSSSSSCLRPADPPIHVMNAKQDNGHSPEHAFIPVARQFHHQHKKVKQSQARS